MRKKSPCPDTEQPERRTRQVENAHRTGAENVAQRRRKCCAKTAEVLRKNAGRVAEEQRKCCRKMRKGFHKAAKALRKRGRSQQGYRKRRTLLHPPCPNDEAAKLPQGYFSTYAQVKRCRPEPQSLKHPAHHRKRDDTLPVFKLGRVSGLLRWC